MKVKVTDGIQVFHDGEVFADGDTAEVPNPVGWHWIREGWADEVKTAAPARKGTRR